MSKSSQLSSKDTKSKFKTKGSRQRMTFLAFLLGFVVIGGGYFAYKSFAATPTPGTSSKVRMYVAPNATPVSGDFYVPVNIYNDNLSVNAVDVDLWYPSDKLQYLGYEDLFSSYKTSAKSLTNTTFGALGEIKFVRANVAKACTLDCNITALKFRVKPDATGELVFNFGAGSDAASGGANTSALTMTQSAFYTIKK